MHSWRSRLVSMCAVVLAEGDNVYASDFALTFIHRCFSYAEICPKRYVERVQLIIFR